MVTTAQPSPRHTTYLSKRFIALTVALACFFLLLFNTAVWFNQYIFNTQKFSQTALPALQSDSSTQAIASEVTDRLLQDRPLLRSSINDRVVSLVAALLQTDLSDKLIQKSVSTLQVSITSANPKIVAIDLSGIKNIISQILTIGRQLTDRPVEEQRINIEDIPNQIVILNPKTLPNIYNIGVVTLWLAPIALLVVLGAIAYPLYRAYRLGVHELKKLLTIQGAAILATGLLGLALGPLITPPVLAQVPSENLRVVTENIVNAFVATFNELTVMILIVPAILMLLIALGIHLWPIVRRYRSSRNKALVL